MANPTTYESRFVRMQVHEAEEIFEYQLKSFIPHKAITAELNQAKALMVNHYTGKVLADLSLMEILNKDDLTYIAQHVMPDLLSKGIRTWAVVPPSSKAGQLVFERYEEWLGESKRDMNRKICQSRQEAFEWLQSQE